MKEIVNVVVPSVLLANDLQGGMKNALNSLKA